MSQMVLCMGIPHEVTKKQVCSGERGSFQAHFVLRVTVVGYTSFPYRKSLVFTGSLWVGCDTINSGYEMIKFYYW